MNLAYSLKKMLIRIQATCFFALCCETWFQQYNCLSKLIIGVYVCVFSDLYILKKKKKVYLVWLW